MSPAGPLPWPPSEKERRWWQHTSHPTAIERARKQPARRGPMLAHENLLPSVVLQLSIGTVRSDIVQRHLAGVGLIALARVDGVVKIRNVNRHQCPPA